MIIAMGKHFCQKTSTFLWQECSNISNHLDYNGMDWHPSYCNLDNMRIPKPLSDLKFIQPEKSYWKNDFRWEEHFCQKTSTFLWQECSNISNHLDYNSMDWHPSYCNLDNMRIPKPLSDLKFIQPEKSYWNNDLRWEEHFCQKTSTFLWQECSNISNHLDYNGMDWHPSHCNLDDMRIPKPLSDLKFIQPEKSYWKNDIRWEEHFCQKTSTFLWQECSNISNHLDYNGMDWHPSYCNLDNVRIPKPLSDRKFIQPEKSYWKNDFAMGKHFCSENIDFSLARM